MELNISGRQNTLPVVLFGKMNSGASPVIYAISGAILILSILIIARIGPLSGRARSK